MDKDSLAKLHDFFLQSLFSSISQAQQVVITTHRLADVDAMASVIALKNILFNKFPDKKVAAVIPQVNRLAEKLQADLFPTPQITPQWPSYIDVMVILDANDLKMTEFPLSEEEIGKVIPLKTVGEIFIIDHHIEPVKVDPRIKAMHILNNYSSTAEIVAEFFIVLGISTDLVIAKILLLAILTDTGNFRYANNHTLENTEHLLGLYNLNIRDLIILLQIPMPRPERIARIRAAMRIEKLHYLGDFVLAISHVSSYEASSCKALIDLGADMSFVIAYNKKEKNFRISSRASEETLQKGVHLGKFMGLLGEKFGGSGGGHNGAAGCYGNAPPDSFMETITPILLSTLRQYLRTLFVNIEDNKESLELD